MRTLFLVAVVVRVTVLAIGVKWSAVREARA